jgi:hypothetical protein
MAWTNRKGFNFRDTLAYVTDGANEVAIIGDGSNNIAAASAYPRSVTIDGDTFNVGWNTVSGDGARNRNTAYGANLAGGHLINNSEAGGRVFRINIPAPGIYELTLGMGENSARQYWQVLDDASVLETFDFTGAAMSTEDFYDAEGTKHETDDLWRSSQVPKEYTFSSSIVNIRIGSGTGVGAHSVVEHIGILLVGSASTIVNRETGRRGVGRGVLRGV